MVDRHYITWFYKLSDGVKSLAKYVDVNICFYSQQWYIIIIHHTLRLITYIYKIDTISEIDFFVLKIMVLSHLYHQ